ncbi:MAG: fumarylacetoacetate hydrolase family protein [Bacteroidales bacterium]|nr:fumarylacetoacetate hydrolase family protein [Bacteroidales bacterium]
MKIICVGMNYAEHCKELSSSASNSKELVIFLKPDSALLQGGRPFFIPDHCPEPDYETELVVRVSRLGKYIAPRFAHRYYDAVTVGIDFTNRELQKQMRAKGLPWEICKGFDSSAVVGRFVELPAPIQQLDFHLDIDGQTVQTGNTADMTTTVDDIIAYASQFFTLKMGDLIFTGTPAGVGKVRINQHLEGYLNDDKLLDFFVR